MKKKYPRIAMSTDDSWRVEGDLNTMMEAEKIRCDPKRMAAVQKLAKEKMMDVAKVAMDEGDSA
jgi:hypothetical protein